MSSSPELRTGVAFGELEARLRAAVQAAASTDPDPADPLRGLYISNDQALALAGAQRASAPEDRLAEATHRLGLDPLESAVLGLCAAPEIDAACGRMFAYLHDDVTRRLASPRLIARLLAPDGVPAADVLATFAPESPLCARGALRLVEDGSPTPLADRPAKVADRLAGFLLGLAADSRGVAAFRRVAPASVLAGREETVAEASRILRSGTTMPVVVAGPDAATLVANAIGAPLLVLAAHHAARPEAIADATLACALEGRRLCIDGLDDIDPGDRGALLECLDRLAEPHRLAEPPVLLARSRRGMLALGDRTVLLVDVPMPSFAERERAWRELTGATETRDVAAKFRLSIEQIQDAAEIARVSSPGPEARRLEAADLDSGARHASASSLGELARRLPTTFGWDDLVVPERQRELLRSVSARLRHRDRVLSDWGYERTAGGTPGLKVLFAGESGTGKTMAAQVLGADLGLELFRVDLATVVSKYIGETEKNLSRIFAAAEGSNAMLFFDEADALFGKRSEVSDAHDRYANIEVAYLLQEMEAYPGAVILATNFRRNIDDAFIRRLDFVVDFPFPDVEDRRRIWRLLLPAAAPVDDDVDLEFLAANFRLSGGAIRNCSLAAAFRAADEDVPIGMRHLVLAVAHEYTKQGRLTLEADFERFHPLIRPAV